MQKFNGSLVRQFPSLITGNAAAGVSVTVYTGTTGTNLATLYSGNGIGSLPNPLTTDAAGYYGFYAADGQYRLKYSVAGIPDQLIQLLDAQQVVDEFGTGSGLIGQAATQALQDIAADVSAVDVAKVSGLADIAADVSSVDDSRISAVNSIASDATDVDNSRISAQAAIASSQNSVLASANSSLASISSNLSEVQAAASDALAEIPEQINRLGLQYPPIPYTGGLLLDSNTKTYSRGGLIYVYGGALGVTANGNFTESGWQPLQGDLQLRNDVTAGTALIKSVKHVESVTALRALSGAYNGQTVQLVSYYAGANKGGGVLVWNSTSTAADDGGVTFAVTGVATGRWVRSLEGYVTPEMFGAGGDGSASDLTPMLDSERGFFNTDENKPEILRLRDRLFVGDGVLSSGSRTVQPTESFLVTTLGAHYLERAAQLLSLSSSGKYGGVFATRASDQAKYGMTAETAVGVAGIVINDNESANGLGWAAYFEANKVEGKGTVFGAEFAVKNKGANVINTPFNKFGGAGATIGTWFAGGGDSAYFGAAANPSTCAILIGKNGAAWNKGIVFDAEGLAGLSGGVGSASAIAMANKQRIEWFSSNTNISLQVTSEIDDANKNMNITAFNSFLAVLSRSNSQPNFAIDNTQAPVSYVAVSAKSDANAPAVEARGTAANIDLMIKPKGGGVVQFGYLAASATTPANFTATHRITVRDSSGTIYYIPARASQW